MNNIESVRTPGASYKELSWLPGYAIGDDGSFISLAKEVPLFRKGDKEPYAIHRRGERRITIEARSSSHSNDISYRVKTSINRKREVFQIARLVLIAHRCPPPSDEKWIAWSLDRNPANARIENLRWVKRADTKLVTTDSGLKKLLLKEGAKLH